MGAAAELHGIPLSHVHHPHGAAVLLAKQGDGPFLFGFLDGQYVGAHVVAGQNRVVDDPAHLGHLLRGHGLEVGEVEAKAVGLHQRTGLVDVVPQHLPQGLVQQVGGGMGPGDGLPALPVDLGAHGVAHLQHALGHLAVVHIFAALVLLHVSDLESHLVGEDHAMVGHLTAHLGVEGGLVQHHNALHAGHQLLCQLVLHHQGHHLHPGDGLDRVGAVIAHKLCLGHVLAELHPGPAQVAQGLPGLPGPPALLVHELLELGLVQLQALFLHHLQGQVHGEAVGIIELERVRAGEGLFPLLLVA